MKISPGSTLHFDFVLVVRNTTKLMKLANDNEYYNSVPCTIVQLDSFDTDISSTIYCATFFNNLAASILINNADVII